MCDQNDDSGIEKELLSIFEECNENGTDCVKLAQLIDKIKFFLEGNENIQEILAVVKLKLDPHGNRTFISKEYFIQCISEWLDSKQQQEQQPVSDDEYFPLADTNENEVNYSFFNGLNNGRNIFHSTPVIKKPKGLLRARTVDVYSSQPDSSGVSVETHTALENEIKDMRQDMLIVTRERDKLEMTVGDLRNHISFIEKKNVTNENLLTQTVNKLKNEVEKKLELEKCNEELVKMNSDTEKEMANVNKKFASLMKTCEDQRAQNVILEQMLSDATDENKKQKEELEKLLYEHNEEKEMYTDKIALLMEEITQKNFVKLNLEKRNAELQEEINSQVTVTQNLRLELLKYKSSATKAEEKYLQMKLNVDHLLKSFGNDIQSNIKGSLGSPEEISLISTSVFGFSPVKYENSLMAEIGPELDDKKVSQPDEDCVLYETLSTQTEFIEKTKAHEDATSQTEDNITVTNKRLRVCEDFIHESLTFIFQPQLVDHFTQTSSNCAVDSASQTDDASKKACSVGCGDTSTFSVCNQHSQTLPKSSLEVDASTQTTEPSDDFLLNKDNNVVKFQKTYRETNERRVGKNWLWYGVTGVTFIMIFCFLFHTMLKWSCNSPCCVKSGQYWWSLNKLFLSRNRHTVPV